MSLPVTKIIPELLNAITTTDVLLSAPPGAGKSTAIPMALLKANVGKILLLQPRRVVAKQLAKYLASQLDEEVGNTVGYRIRGEQACGKHTRLEIITDGILTRRLQQDPELEDVAIVLFDEFHERSLYSDFSLALTIEAQQLLRQDLRLVVMSATLDVSPLQTLLPQARVLSSQGRRFPVEEVYLGPCPLDRLSLSMAQQIRTVVAEQWGDILVFLPTVAMINQVQALIEDLSSDTLRIHPLHGSLPIAQQQRAIEQAPAKVRKIILATNIAETSLTIEGVRLVIDSGRQQSARFHPGNQMTELSIEMISQASAEQRKGRAGRLESGICYRFWSREGHGRLSEFHQADIQTQDVLPLVLHAAAWGTPLPQLPLLDTPSDAQLRCATEELQHLQLLNATQSPTALGRQVLTIAAHPRFASMLMRCKQAKDAELLAAGCYVAAVAEEAPKTTSWLVGDVRATVPSNVQQALLNTAKRYARQLECKLSPQAFAAIDDTQLATVIALARPGWIAKATSKGRYKLAMGSGASLNNADAFRGSWLAVLSGQRKGADMVIRLAQPIDETQLRALLPELFSRHHEVFYDAEKDAVKAQEQHKFANITLHRQPMAKINAAQLSHFWCQWLAQRPLAQWPMYAQLAPTLHRLAMAKALALRTTTNTHQEHHSWPSIDAKWLLQADEILTAMGQCHSVARLTALNWPELIIRALPWYQQQTLAQQLPTHLEVPSGAKRRLNYVSAERVILATRMQDMYGCNRVLSIAQGAQTVVVELLSPAQRPIQTTDNLPRFWAGSYSEVRKEMKGRYPKHLWPEDPTRIPTR